MNTFALHGHQELPVRHRSLRKVWRGWSVPLWIGVLSFTMSGLFLAGMGDLSAGFRMITVAVVVLVVVSLACSRFGSRQVAIIGLVSCIPVTFNHHFIYRRGYVGASDGIAVELIDVWMVWLAIEYLRRRRAGELQPVRSLMPFYVPLGLLLVADVLSSYNSVDLALSIYGIVNHLRAAFLFVILAITLAQGVRERQAAFWGVLCAVASVGALCMIETAIGSNFRADPLVDQMADGIFRAGALDTPTGTAAYLVELMPLVAIGYFCSRATPRRLFSAISLGLGLAGLICTITRGATGILLIASIPLIIYLYLDRRIRWKHVLLVVVASVVVFAIVGNKIKARLDEGDDNLNARIGLTGTAINMGVNSFVIGQGVNNYWLKMHRFRPKTEMQDFEYIVHNKYLLTFAESGLLGLTTFVWLIVVSLVFAVRIALRGSPIGVGLVCSMIALVVSMNFEPYDVGPSLLNVWMLLAMVAGMWSGTPSAVRAS